RPMAIEIREARPEEYEEAGRVTALAYREFVPAEGGDDWEGYLGRMADIAERAGRTRILLAVEDGGILGTVTLELDGRVGDWNDEPSPAPRRGAHPDARGGSGGARARRRHPAHGRVRGARPRRRQDLRDAPHDAADGSGPADVRAAGVRAHRGPRVPRR